jgi:hypothetical protein
VLGKTRRNTTTTNTQKVRRHTTSAAILRGVLLSDTIELRLSISGDGVALYDDAAEEDADTVEESRSSPMLLSCSMGSVSVGQK